VIVEADLLPWKKIEPDYTESSELLAIFTSIGKSGKIENPKRV